MLTLCGADVAIIINDSSGRPWRNGIVGIAIGAAGLTTLHDLRGEPDLFGRRLEVTETATADELASAGSLLQGQGSQGMPVVLIRGFTPPKQECAQARHRTGARQAHRHVPLNMKCVALCGGVGGAKLALGLTHILPR